MDLTLNDFQKVSDEVPFLADLKPSGKYVMEDVHKVCQNKSKCLFPYQLYFHIIEYLN